LRLSHDRIRRSHNEGQRHAYGLDGFHADQFVGRRLHQFLNMAGRIYYETHIAPLLRMQGSFNEFALDFETAAGERLPVIANAAERRDADGCVLFTALVVMRATDRRRYERQLVESRSESQKGLATERETAELREQFIAVLGHDLRIHSRPSAPAPEFCRARCTSRRNSVFLT
jgi:sigma-B regulation protein RsbU (phosphoserine phosphatase)